MSARAEIPDGSIHLSTKKPITVDVDNAITIGLNESIVLSQLRYWIEDTTSGKVVDDERWVYNTYEGWQKSSFPFWSVATIRRVFSSLEGMELIKSRDDLNPKGSDRTKWYTINFSHSAYGQGVSRPSAQNEQAMCSKRAGHVLNLSGSSIAETTAETTAETSFSSGDEEKAPTVDEMFETFWQAYPKPKPNRHSRKESLAKFKGALKKASFEEIMDGLEWFKVQEDWTKDNGKWIPGAQKWLNQEMWEAADEQPASHPSETNVSRPVTAEEIERAKNHEFVPAFGHGWVERELERRKREQQEMDGLL